MENAAYPPIVDPLAPPPKPAPPKAPDITKRDLFLVFMGVFIGGVFTYASSGNLSMALVPVVLGIVVGKIGQRRGYI